ALCAFSTPPSSIFPQKNFAVLPFADCSFNQHTGKTQKMLGIFFAAFQYSPLLFCLPKAVPLHAGKK
ncbi:hypothetical protein, partial [uncultured Desulfovibrio sp.]|uniref:hypothetical protein n=1 Tax=uncultured Desulfovibrio sp. TaxID=167968 RepID=UPI00265D330B